MERASVREREIPISSILSCLFDNPSVERGGDRGVDANTATGEGELSSDEVEFKLSG